MSRHQKSESSRSNRVVKRIAVASVVVALSVAGCRPESLPEADVVRPVRTTVISTDASSTTPPLPAIASSAREVELAFQVGGLLANLPVQEGQVVKKGDIIAELRPDEFRARLASLQGQLEQSQAVLRTLQAGDRPEQRARLESNLRAAEANAASEKAQFARFKSLLDTGAIARSEFDRAEADYRVSQEQVLAAQQLIEIGRTARVEDIEARQAEIRSLEGRMKEAALQLQDASLRAPFDGVVARRFVDSNQSITTRQPIIRFQSVDELDVTVDVPETLMASDLRSADLTNSTAEFIALPGKLFPIRLGEVAQVADPVTQTFRVRFALKTPPGVNILPGMSGVVRLGLKQNANGPKVVLVPMSAIYTVEGAAPIAWVITPDMTASKRPVKLGEIRGGNVEVLEGLKAGERIATAGVARLRDNMKVRDLGNALGGK